MIFPHRINMHCFLKHTQDVSQLEPVREEELFSGFPIRNCKPSNGLISLFLSMLRPYSLMYHSLPGLLIILMFLPKFGLQHAMKALISLAMITMILKRTRLSSVEKCAQKTKIAIFTVMSYHLTVIWASGNI